LISNVKKEFLWRLSQLMLGPHGYYDGIIGIARVKE
jgi:hypothetical protein